MSSTGDASAGGGWRNPDRDFVAGGVIAVAIAAVVGVLHLYSAAVPSHVDDMASLSDLLVVGITISGISVPVMIGYLSLGRSADIFSEVGDCVPYFMELSELPIIATSTALLSELGEDPSVEESQLLLDALDQMRILRNASARFLDPDIKKKFIPDDLIDDYNNYLSDNADREIVWKYIYLVGAPAAACVLMLYASHYHQIDGFWSWFAHMASILAIVANGLAAVYFIDLGKVRENLQTHATRLVREACESVASMLPQARAAAQANQTDAASRLAEHLARMKGKP